jgi:hypothetical protein
MITGAAFIAIPVTDITRPRRFCAAARNPRLPHCGPDGDKTLTHKRKTT